MTANEYGISLWSNENVLKLDSGTWLHDSVYVLKKLLNCTFKMGEFILCKLYLNKVALKKLGQ